MHLAKAREICQLELGTEPNRRRLLICLFETQEADTYRGEVYELVNMNVIVQGDNTTETVNETFLVERTWYWLYADESEKCTGESAAIALANLVRRIKDLAGAT